MNKLVKTSQLIHEQLVEVHRKGDVSSAHDALICFCLTSFCGLIMFEKLVDELQISVDPRHVFLASGE
jgi:hypothetical protein